MLTNKFWEDLGSNLAGQWNVRLLTPPFALWSALLLSWLFQNKDWINLQCYLESLYSQPVNGVIHILGLLFILLFTDGLVSWFSVPFIQFVEGYWGFPLGWLRSSLTNRVNATINQKIKEHKELKRKYDYWTSDPQNNPKLARQEFEKLTQLESEVNQYPSEAYLRMPSRLGNLLRTAEEFPWLAYGLEITHTWPHLWLVLPQEIREEVSAARQELVKRAQFMLYGLLYMLISLGMAIYQVGILWAPVLGLFVALISYYIGMLPAAETYGRLLRAAYAVHRFDLYKALCWHLPMDDARERISGEQITLYLASGLAPQDFVFKHRDPG